MRLQLFVKTIENKKKFNSGIRPCQIWLSRYEIMQPCSSSPFDDTDSNKSST